MFSIFEQACFHNGTNLHRQYLQEFHKSNSECSKLSCENKPSYRFS